MPRPKTEALVELSTLMEQAHQLESALHVIETRVAPPGKKAKKRKNPAGKKGAAAGKSKSEVR